MPDNIPIICPDNDSLIERALLYFVAQYRAATHAYGQFHVALSGGSTPARLYSALVTHVSAQTINWHMVHIYFGDERMVPTDHPDSNYRMARQTLLDHIAIPAANIHPIPTDCDDFEECAQRYADTLMTQLVSTKAGVPIFDLILLGIGPDGHTASLFPGTPILLEYKRPVAAVYLADKSSWRISLTYPVLNHARHLLILVSGASKQQVVYDLFGQNTDKHDYPVANLHPTGSVEWLIDAEAAQKLPGK
ncbi:MAG TPA: 6-phosphogluconolactonase [Gammaproteobacteria bacterium]|nr:6-phosphogluconolactonase [Gammaproteobacteria bacterium]